MYRSDQAFPFRVIWVNRKFCQYLTNSQFYIENKFRLADMYRSNGVPPIPTIGHTKSTSITCDSSQRPLKVLDRIIHKGTLALVAYKLIWNSLVKMKT